MNVVISQGPATDSSGKTLTLTPVGPVGSTFTTGDQAVTITNKGTIPVQEIVATPGDTYVASAANTALHNQVYLCEVSSNTVIYNGPLSAAPAQQISGTLPAGQTDGYTVNVYAGQVTTACGAVTTIGAPAPVGGGTSTAPTLTDAAQGGVIDPTLTVSYTG